jgi:hypothetical protein
MFRNYTSTCSTARFDRVSPLRWRPTGPLTPLTSSPRGRHQGRERGPAGRRCRLRTGMDLYAGRRRTLRGTSYSLPSTARRPADVSIAPHRRNARGMRSTVAGCRGAHAEGRLPDDAMAATRGRSAQRVLRSLTPIGAAGRARSPTKLYLASFRQSAGLACSRQFVARVLASSATRAGTWTEPNYPRRVLFRFRFAVDAVVFPARLSARCRRGPWAIVSPLTV